MATIETRLNDLLEILYSNSLEKIAPTTFKSN